MIKSSLSKDSDNIWVRGAYILLFGFIYSVAEVVMIAVIVLQFLFILFTKEKNVKLLIFGAELSSFLYQVFQFLTFNSDTRPFPFANWPETSS